MWHPPWRTHHGPRAGEVVRLGHEEHVPRAVETGLVPPTREVVATAGRPIRVSSRLPAGHFAGEKADARKCGSLDVIGLATAFTLTVSPTLNLLKSLFAPSVATEM